MSTKNYNQSSNDPFNNNNNFNNNSNFYSEDQNLTPIQRQVFAFYRDCREEIGLHSGSVIRSLNGRYSEKDVRNAIDTLISEGLIYLTIDSDHARNVSA